MTYQEEHIAQFIDIIFQWDKALRNLERRFNKKFDLTLNQCRLVLFIHDKQYVELSKVHLKFGIDKSTTTRMIRPLITDGLIDKFYQFGDKRKIFLKISEKGLENVEHIKEEVDKIASASLLKVPAGKRDFTFQTVRDLINVI